MSMAVTVATLLALAVLAGSLRQILRWRRMPAQARPASWRMACMLVLQFAGAALLYMTLFPPAASIDPARMVVMTAGTDAAGARAAGGGNAILVALPEADATAVRDAEARRMPDLATALRMHPQARSLQVLGAGLEARDLGAAQDLSIEFRPPPLPNGLVELQAPPRVVSGGMLRVSGRMNDVADGRVELLDPAGNVQDRASLDNEGRFLLQAPVRASGPAIYRLRVAGDAGSGVEVPVDAGPGAGTRLLLLAGAPNPEIKYLRRWASDAGLSLHSHMALGGGVSLGDGAVAFDPKTLSDFDLAIVDERAWADLGANARSALLAAVDDGLGLMLRISGKPDAATREAMRQLGFRLGDADPALDRNVILDAVATVDRSAAPAEAAVSASAEADADASPTPPLARQPHPILAPDSLPLLTDASGAVLARWRPSGLGRIAVWNIDQSFRLVLGGHGQRHARLWADATGTLARPRAAAQPRFDGIARHGQRAVLCDFVPGTPLVAADGTRLHPLADPAATGCAAVWPARNGWHRLGDGEGAPMLYVRPADALPGLVARERRDATLRLSAGSTERRSEGADGIAPLPVADAAPINDVAARTAPRWPWFIAWLLASGLLWWLERGGRRIGDTPARV